MASAISPCHKPQTKAAKEWPYHEYYVGERDEEQRKSGDGTNHWSGAESLEWYTGRLLRDTMHGIGEYHCRYRGENHLAFTHEGHFYNNSMHGYGVTSYPDGKVFSGFYYNNVRWGPGVETHVRVRENVGLWRGNRLIRLTWKPDTPSVAPDLLSTVNGREVVARHRCLLVAHKKTIGQTNPALELLKQCGANPLTAAKNWTKLYPKNCTDPKSQLYHRDVFDRAYYNNEIDTLEPFVNYQTKAQIGSLKSNSILSSDDTYYSWNNNEMIVHMMRHCYQHDKQLPQTDADVAAILNGPRTLFKPASEHELNCRAFLLACYLGNIKTVAQLINAYDVNPNVTDIQGNSALMYAACGCQPKIIHFLVEAGAEIDDYNDACCTPLGAVLLNYVCAELNIPPSAMITAVLPNPSGTASVQTEKYISEWKINRNFSTAISATGKKDLETPTAKLMKSVHSTVTKKNRSVQSFGSKVLKKLDVVAPGESKMDAQGQNSDVISDENRLYLSLVNDFQTRINEMITQTANASPVNYIFGINNMITEIDIADAEDQKKITEKKDTKKDVSKVIKDVIKKPSVELATHLELKPSLDSKAKLKADHLEVLMETITQLLSHGADPTRVCCPQPALFVATVAQTPDLIRSLVKSGAKVNEVYPQVLNYTPLDVAISHPLSYSNLEVVRTLLEIGAKPDHRLIINDQGMDPDTNEPGPTLLHAVLAKQCENEANEEVRHQLLELLLQYGCDPIAQYKGRSTLDIAMSKSLDIFDIFIESPHTDLNSIINRSNQSILLKMFYLPYCKSIGVNERLQMLTNLLLFGADPLLKCRNEEIEYDNLFVYAKFTLSELETTKAASPTGKQDVQKKSKSEVKGKEKAGASAPTATKSAMGAKANSTDDIGDYKQALSLVTNCARLLIIRWIQAKLMKDLILVVDRFKHRHWNMILKEYKNTRPLGLWLSPVRCLEIWDILKTTKKRIYNDQKILKHVLCIVLYYFKKVKKNLRPTPISSEDKASIETEVTYFIRENNFLTKVGQVLKRPYVTPELTPNNEIDKFKVCFECAIPLNEDKISCNLCKLVDFCSFDCMRDNIERYNCHPCSTYLKKKFFPSPELSDNELIVV